MLMEVISGVDGFDSTLSNQPVPSYSKQLATPKKLRVAYLEDCFEKEGLDPEIKAHLLSTLEQLKKKVTQLSRFGFLIWIISFLHIMF